MVRSISRNRIVRNVFTKLAPLYDTLEPRLTYKRGERWRARALALANLENPRRVLDGCAGTGLTSLSLAAAYGAHCHIVAIDLCPAMLALARQRLRAHNFQRRVEFKTENIEIMPFPDEFFDGIFITFGMRFVSDIRTVLKECHRVLRPGARLAVLELALPPNPLVRLLVHAQREYGFAWGNRLRYGMPASLTHALFDPLLHYPDADKFGRMLVRAGFDNIQYEHLGLGTASLHLATRMGA